MFRTSLLPIKRDKLILRGIEYMNIVCFTQRVEIITSYKERRDCADQRISKFINTCGYLPVPLPNIDRLAKEYMDKLRPCGIILSGGNSLIKYGGDAPERDMIDKNLIEYSIQNNIPIYGFCRGMQSILDYFGMPLYQIKGHVGVRHKLHDRNVNSYHNQGTWESSEEIEIVYKSSDGIVEGVKHKKYPIFGTMWHPEREEPFCAEDIRMVQMLFGASECTLWQDIVF